MSAYLTFILHAFISVSCLQIDPNPQPLNMRPRCMTCWTMSPAWSVKRLKLTKTNQEICLLLDYFSLINGAWSHQVSWRRTGAPRRGQETELTGTGCQRRSCHFVSSPQSKVDAYLFCCKESHFSTSVPVLPKWSLAPGEAELQIPPNQQFPHVKRILRFKDFGTYWGEGGDHLIFVRWRVGVAPGVKMFEKKKALLISWHMFRRQCHLWVAWR